MEVESLCPPGGGFLQQGEKMYLTGSNKEGEIEEDERVEWLRRRVCAGLDIPETLFTSFLLDNKTLLVDFLETSSASWLILYTAIPSAHGTPRPNLSSVNSTATPVVTFTADSMELHAYTASHPKDLGRTAEHMMYFMKLKTGGFTTWEDLDVWLEYGVLPAGPSLDSLEQLETAANDWLPIIDATIQQETQKIPMGKYPLSELDFWRERVNTLSSLHGQLSSQRIKNIMIVLEAGSSNIELLQSFKSQFTDLNKLFLEAKDNVNFLTTLERHFKGLVAGFARLWSQQSGI